MSTTTEHATRFERVLTKVQRPARYVGGEVGQVVKDPATVACRMALVFPDLYEVGLSNYGLQILYYLLNAREDTWCERAYAVAPDMEAVLREQALPLMTHESRTPLHALDLIGFGLQSELTYINVLQVLDLGGIPMRAAERGDDAPLIVAGGHGAFNPEPLAEIVDAFGIGDGEDVIVDIRDCWMQSKGLPRRERLSRLAKIEGVYVPAMYTVTIDPDGWEIPEGPRVVKRNVKNLDETFFPTMQLIPWTETVHDRISIEVMRGCTQGCRFCQAGMITRPIRERSPEKVVAIAKELAKNTGMDEISLLSLSTADHKGAIPMARGVRDTVGKPMRVNISLPSSRADAFNVELSSMVGGERKGGITLAPEAGSDRLRRVINKYLTEDDIVNAVQSAAQGGHKHVKLYFMTGLPTETDDDLIELVGLVERCEKAGQRIAGPRFGMHIGLSGLVPKPHTPFQWCAQLVGPELTRRYRLVRDRLHKRIKVNWAESEERTVEGILSRGDRRAGRLMMEAYARGARLDAWNEYLRIDLWKDAAEALGFSIERYLGERDMDARLPWWHIDAGVTDRFLKSEWKKAVNEMVVRDCREGCLACNACDITGVEMQFGDLKMAPKRDAVIRAWKRQQGREAPV
ncbi:MAG: TIGR03960 family B12-binding radical SAM protein [Proteobacteria bacterium]|nr:TIGR03960 family B12-binding radical SAM protein [Pseudomonadota bacterium]